MAILFEADDGTVTKVTYRELYEKVCRFANGLKALGYKKGERAIIYMPMSVEGIVAMQACARLGLIHSVVFGGFSSKSLQERIQDAGATLVIAADEQVRGGKKIPLKPAVDEAFTLGGCDGVRHVVGAPVVASSEPRRMPSRGSSKRWTNNTRPVAAKAMAKISSDELI